ncbi:hypothetical protein L208DRAFT_1329905 [Tricholoma matsutake]|nr:hypothetical protein L208DRAFT_1329905 [Tricholoma matsutake 945]
MPHFESNQLSINEANILFFRGIPKAQQKMIQLRLPADKTKVQSPPSRDDVLALLQKEFDEDDIANDKYSADTSADSSSDRARQGLPLGVKSHTLTPTPEHPTLRGKGMETYKGCQGYGRVCQGYRGLAQNQHI